MIKRIDVKIGNNSYQLACEVGEEERLKYLVAKLSARTEMLFKANYGASDATILLMSALIAEDELDELKAKHKGNNFEDEIITKIEMLANKVKDL